MRKYILIRSMIFTLALAFWNMNTWASEYNYRAEVNGMVCAFCAYSVSKNISTLPGVEADSVDVDLKAGHVAFKSKQPVSEKKLTSVFTQSGFTISNLTEKESSTDVGNSIEAVPGLDLSIDIYKSEQFRTVLDAIGNISASTPSSLLIEAPALFEETLLKPILMGRQQVIKVRFVPTDTETIRLQLYALKGGKH